jgi:hypothetical protein
MRVICCGACVGLHAPVAAKNCLDEALMKLYVTFTSPYARLARIVVLEKGLQDRVEVIAAQTRVASSPYYRINPSGRVPYLIDDAGVGMEDSRLEARARSLCDGIAVWVREMSRPVERTLSDHPRARGRSRPAPLTAWQLMSAVV